MMLEVPGTPHRDSDNENLHSQMSREALHKHSTIREVPEGHRTQPTSDSSPAGTTPEPITEVKLLADAPPMHDGRWKSLRTWLFWSLQVALALGIGYWIAMVRSTRDDRIELSADHARVHKEPGAVTVTTAPIMRRNLERSIEAVGNLHGYDELTLKTKVSGRVLKIYHEFADSVAPGELLLEIDPTDAELAVEQAKRSLNSELAKWGFTEVPKPDVDLSQLPTVTSARIRAELSRSQYTRLLALQRGAVTAEEIEQTKTNALVAETDYANSLLLARAGVATAQLKKADLDIAEQQLLETRVYVPKREAIGNLPNAHYTITDRHITEGALLAVGSDLFRLVINETLKLRLSVSEKYAQQVKAGQCVEVTTLTTAAPVIGTVARIGPSVDPLTRTFQIEAEVPNPNGELKTGGFAKARVIMGEKVTADTIPVAALVTFAGIHKVFALEDNKAVEYRVELGEQSSEWIEIVNTKLPADAQIIVSGQSQLADGSLVSLRDPAAGSAPTTGGATQ